MNVKWIKRVSPVSTSPEPGRNSSRSERMWRNICKKSAQIFIICKLEILHLQAAAPLKIFLFHKSMKIASSSPVTGHNIASTGAQKAEDEVTLQLWSQRNEAALLQWQYCTLYRMIYFLYEVNCCFLRILLHKYLILCFYCFFTSYSREIIIQKKIWFHSEAK